MKEMLYFITGFSSLSILFGIVERHRDVNKLRDLARKTRRFLPKKKFSIRDWIGALIAITDITLLFFVAFINPQFINHEKTIISLYLITTITSLVLMSMRYNIFSKENPLSSILKKIIGVAAILITVISSIYADQEISRLTNIDPSFFPNAQKAITLILSPFAWAVFIFFFNLFVYFIIGVKLIYIEIIQINYINNVINSISLLLNIKRNKKRVEDLVVNPEDIGLMAGLAVSIILMPLIIKLSVDTYHLDDKINELLIFSSYQENTFSCENIDDKSAKIAYLKDKAVSIATRKNNKYIFTISTCDRPISSKLTKN